MKPPMHRLLALLLTFTLIISLLPTTVLADDTGGGFWKYR